uniref:Uncharacterized protein n=1 Tax=Plectus sambesii TaxID=2011161 RepID=A0A914W8I4_9BILA
MSNVTNRQEITLFKADATSASNDEKRPQRHEPTSATVSKYLYVAAFAYFGVSTRVLLTWLSREINNPLLDRLGDSFFLPNAFGSFLLGFVNSALFSRLANFDSTNTLKTGLASGFCGSCTTFASWQLIAAQRMLGGDWSTAVVQSAITFCTSYMAAGAGRSIGQPTSQQSCKTEQKADSTRAPFHRALLLSSLIFFILPTIVVWTKIATEADVKSRYFWVAVAFSPLGALIRYQLSLRNASHPTFPVYTLAVNLCGCFGNICILVLGNYLTNSQVLDDNWLAAFNLWILNGISVGLMGSLSTVSTWINEIWHLANKGRMYHSYRYAVVSVLSAQIICLSIGATYLLTSGRSLSLTDID